MRTQQFAPYATSQDYARLAQLAKQHRVVCFVDHSIGVDRRNGEPALRDIASTHYRSRGTEEYWSVGVRGGGYIDAYDLDEFVRQCRAANLTFIDIPTSTAETA